MVEDILYCNDGDWVESLTALVEHADGRLAIVDWGKVMAGQEMPFEAKHSADVPLADTPLDALPA